MGDCAIICSPVSSCTFEYPKLLPVAGEGRVFGVRACRFVSVRRPVTGDNVLDNGGSGSGAIPGRPSAVDTSDSLGFQRTANSGVCVRRCVL